jgi:hypothetical protein
MEPGERRSLFIVLLICAVAMIGAAYFVRYLQHNPKAGWGRVEPEMPLYPGADAKTVRRQKADVLGWQGLFFHVDENYPSTNVYEFYRSTLEAEGYTPTPKDYQSKWAPGEDEKEKGKVILSADWVSPSKLHVFHLEITAAVKIRRNENGAELNRETLPGLQVDCNLSRKVILE